MWRRDGKGGSQGEDSLVLVGEGGQWRAMRLRQHGRCHC